MKSVIVIPTRFGSTRLPGKPLLQLAGKTMLERVHEVAVLAARSCPQTEVVIATDDERIFKHANSLNAHCVMTPKECQSGSERALEAVKQLSYRPDFIVNLQGDAPLTPPEAVSKLITRAGEDLSAEVFTIGVKLSWIQLDNFREHKKVSPFSGTSIIVDDKGNGVWFSKNIIPAIRSEEKLRMSMKLSPVFRHFGVYGYRYRVLQEFVTLPPTRYERLESLEQLRLIENGHTIKIIQVEWPYPEIVAGIDTIEDARKAEEFLVKYK